MARIERIGADQKNDERQCCMIEEGMIPANQTYRRCISAFGLDLEPLTVAGFRNQSGGKSIWQFHSLLIRVNPLDPCHPRSLRRGQITQHK